MSSFVGLFVGLHVLMAQATATPELMMTDDEGKQFLRAAQGVMKHYSVQTTQKTLDIIALLGVTMTIYAPRLVAIQMRRRAEWEEARERREGNVVEFPGGLRPNAGIHVGDPDLMG